MLDYKKLKALTPHFGKTASLYTYKEFEGLLNLRPFISAKRFKPAQDTKRYEWPVYDWHTDKNVWPVSAIKQVLKYSAIYLNDASRANQKINGFSEGLEKVFKKPVDCHIYFSNNSKKSKSFGKHKDGCHNVIVVCEGRINFKIYTNSTETNAGLLDDDKSKVLLTQEVNGNKVMSRNLGKGDYAFVPAGVYHKVETITKKRLSCSFPIFLDYQNTEKGEFTFDEREWLNI